jgi:hypothetical protein
MLLRISDLFSRRNVIIISLVLLVMALLFALLGWWNASSPDTIPWAIRMTYWGIWNRLVGVLTNEDVRDLLPLACFVSLILLIAPLRRYWLSALILLLTLGIIFFGVALYALEPFKPVQSVRIQEQEYHLAYLSDGSGYQQFDLYECDSLGWSCQRQFVHVIAPPVFPVPQGRLRWDDTDRVLLLEVDGEAVFTLEIAPG